MKKSVKEFVLSTINSMHSIFDSSNIVGTPIKINEREVIVPIAKLTFGFGVGGGDVEEKKEKNDLLFEFSDEGPIMGGSLGGLTLVPEAFLYVNNGEVEIIKMKENKSVYDRLFDMYKDVSKYMKKQKR